MGLLENSVSRPGGTVELARWIGVLTPDYELSDFGVAMRWLANQRGPEAGLPPEQGAITGDESRLVEGLLLWLLIRADALLPALMQELQARRRLAFAGLLRAAIARLIAAAEAIAGADQLVPALSFSEFLATLDEDSEREREALLSRLEILRSLRLATSSKGTQAGLDWTATPELMQMAPGLLAVLLTRDGIATLLDQDFFAYFLAAESEAVTHQPTPDQTLLWLARAYEVLRRPLGFTPGRPVALLACLLATEEHSHLEVSDAYECIYAAAASKWSKYLHFSGGSRFDQEFLIRIEPGFLSRLEEGATPNRGTTE